MGTVVFRTAVSMRSRTSDELSQERTVTIVLAPDTEKRDIEIPIQLRKALGAKLTEKLNRLSFSHKKEFVVWYSEAKKEDTRSASREDEGNALGGKGHQLVICLRLIPVVWFQ
jgi:hypothetical protein